MAIKLGEPQIAGNRTKVSPPGSYRDRDGHEKTPVKTGVWTKDNCI